MNLERARPPQVAREFVKCRAGGQHVVDHGDTLAVQVGVAYECPANIPRAVLPRQRGLWRTLAHAAASVGGKADAGCATHDARQFQRLIETAFAQALRCKRHWYDEINRRRNARREGVCQ